MASPRPSFNSSALTDSEQQRGGRRPKSQRLALHRTKNDDYPHKEEAMPKVGGKHFGYDKAGVKAAKEEAKKTGKPMKITRGTKKK